MFVQDQKCSIWIKSVFSFVFNGLCFGVVIKKSLPKPRSPRFSPMFSSRSFIVLGFLFRPPIHFGLNFGYEAGYESRLIVLRVGCSKSIC